MAYVTGTTFFIDINTLPDDFFSTVPAAGVDFVSVFDDDEDDADERMMTTVGLLLPLLLVAVMVAKRPVFSDVA